MADLIDSGTIDTNGDGGDQMQVAVDQLRTGDTAMITLDFPFGIGFAEGGIQSAAGVIFGGAGLTLQDVHVENDTRLVLMWLVP